MGELSTRRVAAHGTRVHPLDWRSGWLAALPFALAWVVAAGALNGALLPRSHGAQGCPPPGSDTPGREREEAPPPPPATHHDGIVFDEGELITV